MPRTSKIISFSLPPEIAQDFEQLSRARFKTKSEFLREIIAAYQVPSSASQGVETTPSDLAHILRWYWEAKSQSPLKVLIVGLGLVINDDNRVLIAARRTPDPLVENLTWSFVGGELSSLNFSDELAATIQNHCDIRVRVKSLIGARVFPEANLENNQIINLYFHCSLAGGEQTLPTSTEKYSQFEWVKPLDIFRYFTSSTADEVVRFLTSLQELAV